MDFENKYDEKIKEMMNVFVVRNTEDRKVMKN